MARPKSTEAQREAARKRRAENWRGVSMYKPLLDDIEKWILAHPEAGYTSLADFLHEAARLRFKIVKLHGPLSDEELSLYAKLSDGNSKE